MPMTREDATAFVQLYAGTDVTPTVTPAEVDLCLTRSRLVDAAGRRPGADGYVETIWASRAVTLVLDAKIAKVATSIDVIADGTELLRSQLVANLERSRKSWAARCLPGSE